MRSFRKASLLVASCAGLLAVAWPVTALAVITPPDPGPVVSTPAASVLTLTVTSVASIGLLGLYSKKRSR